MINLILVLQCPLFSCTIWSIWSWVYNVHYSQSATWKDKQFCNFSCKKKIFFFFFALKRFTVQKQVLLQIKIGLQITCISISVLYRLSLAGWDILALTFCYLSIYQNPNILISFQVWKYFFWEQQINEIDNSNQGKIKKPGISMHKYPCLILTLSQKTNFRLFQIERLCRRQL